MLEEDAEIWVGLRIDGGLEHGEENVLQHFAKVGNKVPASEDVAKSNRGIRKKGILIYPLSVSLSSCCPKRFKDLLHVVQKSGPTRYGALESSI